LPSRHLCWPRLLTPPCCVCRGRRTSVRVLWQFQTWICCYRTRVSETVTPRSWRSLLPAVGLQVGQHHLDQIGKGEGVEQRMVQMSQILSEGNVVGEATM